MRSSEIMQEKMSGKAWDKVDDWCGGSDDGDDDIMVFQLSS